MRDVDFGDLLDYLAQRRADARDPALHRSDHAARKFMSAARAAARNKPVIVVKAGRAAEGARAGGVAHRRAGRLRRRLRRRDPPRRHAARRHAARNCSTPRETLARMRGRCRGERLAIITNGGGAGVLAADALIAAGGELADAGAGDAAQRLDARAAADLGARQPGRHHRRRAGASATPTALRRAAATTRHRRRAVDPLRRPRSSSARGHRAGLSAPLASAGRRQRDRLLAGRRQPVAEARRIFADGAASRLRDAGARRCAPSCISSHYRATRRCCSRCRRRDADGAGRHGRGARARRRRAGRAAATCSTSRGQGACSPPTASRSCAHRARSTDAEAAAAAAARDRLSGGAEDPVARHHAQVRRRRRRARPRDDAARCAGRGAAMLAARRAR